MSAVSTRCIGNTNVNTGYIAEPFYNMNEAVQGRVEKSENANNKIPSHTVIGWREWAGLPDLHVKKINAKIDTGAKSSAMHATDICETQASGAPYVEFCLRPLHGGQTSEIFCHAPIYDKRIIRSSNGKEEERYVIQTCLRLGDRLWAIDLTLTNRELMEFDLLIGRDALGRNFMIDPGASYVLGGAP